jgi:hypothetical protein
MESETRVPTIIIPYPGPSTDPEVQDISIYLRPEANGVKVESTILGVIHSSEAYKKALKIVYLANLPGDFIVENRIIEEHYALNIRFAREGKKAFTDTMRRQFEEYFSVDFESAPITGSFETLERLNMSEAELFRIWVPVRDFIHINGQSVKKFANHYIVNYDIPALLLKNSSKTDVFSMILRSFLSYGEFHTLINSINEALKEEGIITNPVLYSHVFHYSKGPFEQILDGIGYIYTREQEHIDLTQLSFFAYLLSKGCRKEEILDAIRSPIMQFKVMDGKTEEHNLLVYTYDDSFEEAYRKFRTRSTV